MTTTVSPGARISHPIGTAGWFRLRLPDGTVEIGPTEDDIATVEECSGRDLTEDFVIEVGPGRFDIRAKNGPFRISFGRRRPALAIRLPRATRTAVESAAASIEVAGLRGEQRYATASGSVRLSGVAGDLSLDAVSGDVRVRSGGDIALEARTVSADVDVDAGRLLAAHVSTTSGSIRLAGALISTAAYTITTVSGDATIETATDVRIAGQVLTERIGGLRVPRPSGGGADSTDSEGPKATVVDFTSISGRCTLVRHGPDRATGTVPSDEPRLPTDEPRLAILRALERDEIDVAEAARRLEELEDREREGVQAR